MSTKSTQFSGFTSAQALKASYSVGNSCIQLCAMVPAAGIPNISSAIVQAVALHPPITAALAPYIAPS